MPSHFLPQTLPAVRRILPASSVVHVGAGNGVAAGRLWGELGVEHLLLVEADPDEASQLSAVAARVSGWIATCALLGEQDSDDAVYFTTSSPSANGRIHPDDLRALWPNLRGIATRAIPECRLDKLLDSYDPLAYPPPTWICIDCFPALPVLRGAGRYIENVDVVWARVVLDQQALDIEGGSLSEVTAFLSGQGFRPVEVVEGMHPALGDAVFTRDWRGWLAPTIEALEERAADLARRCDQGAELTEQTRIQLDELRQSRGAQASLAAELRQQLEDAYQARESQAALGAKLQSQVDELTQASDAQAHLAAELQRQLAEANQARAGEADLAAKLQSQVDELTQASDAQAHLAAERQRQIDELIQVRDRQARIAAERQAQVAVLTQARDAQTRLATERLAQIEELRQNRDIQGKLAAEREAQIQEITRARDTQTKMAAERQVQVSALIQARDVQARLAAERHTQIEDLMRQQQEHVRQANQDQAAVAHLTEERDHLAGLVEELRSQLQHIPPFDRRQTPVAEAGPTEAVQTSSLLIAERRSSDVAGELAKFDVRQRRVDEEMIRAEAQLDLIKDILFGERRS
jgi:hypothetical protein